ncbi:putative developmental regulator, ULTRAPETALA [Helianthus annuus]|uniref:Developmental regulator, ULTRAPETALA n=1 Tax=Helianthus annuus TaxID=4232 RepID=A0A9K3J2W6_HELAN|nr:putative developmental regulator, ULTRAPETALA [Helianthus annuus]KAJ0585351.1 putative developmental regulator, ULTRAPETALA [Helianthus annuus]KAJ0919872.1 putative developmental regulator, ULTRAPETALA [Helianthus annuus]
MPRLQFWLSAFVGQTMVRAPHYIGIACGCTNNQLEESVGILRISDDDTIIAIFYCNDACNGVFNYLAKFAKHASDSRNVPKWRTKVLVFNCNSEKIKLGETCFLRYYKGDEYVRPHSEVSHRDEFLSCTACYKVRRFELRTWDACRIYHDGAARDVIPSNKVHLLHLKLEFGYLIF